MHVLFNFLHEKRGDFLKKVEELIIELSKCYDGEKGSLDFTTPFELLVAVMLSAQCTDARVNIVTKTLFKIANTPEKFAKMNIKEIEDLISSISFFRNKAKHIKECSIQIIENFNGTVPETMEELTSLSGIGRKSANVIMLEAFNKCEGIAVDTHVLRVSNRLNLVTSDNPLVVEKKLMEIYPEEIWGDLHLKLLFFGRYYCKAKNPECENGKECPFKGICKKNCQII